MQSLRYFTKDEIEKLNKDFKSKSNKPLPYVGSYLHG